MGGVSTPGGKGGNVELNLVPFIDLLSSLVLFLLLSAVWVQVASIRTSVDVKSAKSTPSTTPPPSKRLTVVMSPKGIDLNWPGAAKNLPRNLAKKGESYDLASLKAVIAEAVKQNAMESGALEADDKISYGDVIQAFDSIRAGGLASVSMSTN